MVIYYSQFGYHQEHLGHIPTETYSHLLHKDCRSQGADKKDTEASRMLLLCRTDARHSEGMLASFGKLC